jgi:hypothetical protein
LHPASSGCGFSSRRRAWLAVSDGMTGLL